MKRKILALFLAFILLLPLCPPMAAQAAGSESPEEIIRSAAARLYDDYAAAHSRPNSADGAVEDFLKRSLYGKGTDWALSPNSNTVSTIFGSEVFRESMINVITETLLLMESSGEELFHSYGKTGWHNYYHMYSYLGFRSDWQDYSRFAGTITDTELIYGSPAYVGPTNRNDDALELITGDLFVGYTFRRSSVTEESTTYTIDLHLFDNFDFDGNYSHIGEEGFDTSVDSALKGLGKFLAVMLITEFHWYFKESFTIEIPNSCSHSAGEYSWSSESGSLSPISGMNSAFMKSALSGGSYCELETPVILSHLNPWVVEWSSDGTSPLVLAETKYIDSVYPLLMELGGSIYAHYYELQWLTAEEIAASGVPDAHTFRYHHFGAKLNTEGPRRTVLENRVSEDGSNMIYVSVYDEDGTVLIDSAPMDAHYTRMKGQSQLVAGEESGSSGISGLDFVINYIGNESYPLPSSDIQLSIYPCGRGSGPISMTETRVVDPGCVEGGYSYRRCRGCGLSEVLGYTDPLGHDFGEYESDNNAACLSEGTFSARCTRCGETKLSEEKSPALGHSWDQGTITAAPSTTADGLISFSCTRCGEKREEKLDKLPSGLFSDVPPESWYTEAVYWAVSEGITKGIGEGLFGPELSCTRAQVVSFLWRSAGEPEPTESKNPFSDVSADSYYFKAVLWAVENGISSGTSETTFSPDSGCTRAQVAAFLWRWSGCPEVSEVPSPFEDIPGDSWYSEAVSWALKEGVTSGTSETAFSPDSGCTRAQIVTFLQRACL